MNDRRKALVEKAYDQLDIDQNQTLDIRDVKGKFNAQKHPQVILGQKTEEEVLEEFLHTFEAFRGNNDHHVSKDEWVEYYNNISASIDDDDYFALMINNAWNLDGDAPTYKRQPRHASNHHAPKAFNTRPLNHGNQKYYSGSESKELNVHTSSVYHDQRQAPIRKSLAYSPSRQLSYVETPGETTNPIPFGSTQHVYENFNKT